MSENNMAMLLASYGAGIVICTFIMCVLEIIALWKIFEKANKPGWHALIPFLNTYDEYDIAWDGKYGLVMMVSVFASSLLSSIAQGMSGEMSAIILSCIALVFAIFAFILSIKCMIKLSASFGHGIGFAIGLIFLTSIFTLILGFDNSQYIGKEGVRNEINK